MGTIFYKIKLKGSKGEHEAEALFDTGASMSFIKRSLAEKLETILRLPEPFEFEKGRMIVAEEVVRLDFWLDGDRMSDEFLVLPDEIMTEDVIIGASTMQKWRLVIDMEKEKVFSARKVKKHMLKKCVEESDMKFGNLLKIRIQKSISVSSTSC